MAACGRMVGVVAGGEEEELLRVVVVGAVRDRPLDYLTRPSHPVSCRDLLKGISFFSPSSPVAEPPHIFAEMAARSLGWSRRDRRLFLHLSNPFCSTL